FHHRKASTSIPPPTRPPHSSRQHPARTLNYEEPNNLRRNGRVTKLPITADGRAAARINDPATWSDYATATASSVGVGLGFVLGDGLACIDLDHCLVDGVPTPAAQAMLDRYPSAWVEVSPSGDGLHIWGTASPQPGRRTINDGLSIEFYSRDRYMTVTGATYRGGGLREELCRTF
ncbi:hypothetical protein, partial [Arthrobacter agilis]